MTKTLRKDVKESSFSITIQGVYGRNRKVKTHTEIYLYGAPDMPFSEPDARAELAKLAASMKTKGRCKFFIERNQHTISDYESTITPGGFYTMRSTSILLGAPRDILLRGEL